MIINLYYKKVQVCETFLYPYHKHVTIILNVIVVLCVISDKRNYILSARLELPQENEDRLIQKISIEHEEFIGNVLKLELQVSSVKKNTVLIQFKIKDLWDVHNLLCDILFGMFCWRLVRWLQEDGISIDVGDINVTITSISEKSEPSK